MPLKESYVIWNNKGGVGKTTLTFHMATRYAERNPTVKVLVIDLCPQANVSMTLLSSPNRQGSEHLRSLYRDRKTVSFYLHKANNTGPEVDANEFVTRINKYNTQVPANLFLVCGDMDLELVGRSLEHKRSNLPVFDDIPWLKVTNSMRGFIEGSEGRIAGITENRNEDEFEWVVFIDTNPSFSVYTEIALAAANRLIIPINADDFSKEAVQAMLDLVYGIIPEGRPQDFAVFREYLFSHKAQQYDQLKLPQIHLLVNNRTTTIYTRSAKAFKEMGEQNLKVLFEAYQQHQSCFAPREGVKIADSSVFKRHYYEDVRDFHTTAILSLHSGCPLGALSGRVSLSEEGSVKVDQSKVTEYLKCLDNLVKRL